MAFPAAFRLTAKSSSWNRLSTNSLRLASDLKHLHFSACLTLADATAGERMTELAKRAKFPITGYSTSVDWAASAIIEFAFLDLVLSRKMSAEEAVEQLHLLLPFVGDEAPDGSVFRPAGFRLVLPQKAATQWRPREGVLYA